MIQYDSIPHLKQCKLLGKPVYSFYKYDGSNLRFEFQPKKGFFKFGSRTQLIDEKTPIFGEAINLFQESMAGEILQKLEYYYSKKVFKSFDRIVVFCEFFGENSFAGNHINEDPKELKMFDIHLFKKGFIPPQDFVKMFQDNDFSAKLLYKGNLNQPYIQEVNKNSELLLSEGVICKGVVDGKVEMVKIKTDQWLDKIKGKFDNWESLI